MFDSVLGPVTCGGGRKIDILLDRLLVLERFSVISYVGLDTKDIDKFITPLLREVQIQVTTR